MRQEFLVLAERAEAANGKIFIHGGAVERHFAPGFPTALNVDIAASFLIGWAEANRDHTFQIEIVGSDGSQVMSIDAQIGPGRPPGAVLGQDIRHLMALKGPFPIPTAGSYTLQATADGAAQEPAFQFRVEQMEPPNSSAEPTKQLQN
jgi:hypothetical protein